MTPAHFARLAAQVDLLAYRVDDLPTVIDDEQIFESLSEPTGTEDFLQEILFALFVRIAPALLASFKRGIDSRTFCVRRGIILDPPVGEFDRRALSECIRHSPHGGHWWSGAWGNNVVIPNADNDGRQAEIRSVHGMRDYLAQLLLAHQHRAELLSARIRRSETGLPILTADESSRLLRLVQPLQLTPDRDLPLLLWKDIATSEIRCSWPSLGHHGWTPIDVGLSTPAQLLLARSGPGSGLDDDDSSINCDSGGQGKASPVRIGGSETAGLRRRILFDHPNEMEDDEIIRTLERKYRLLGSGLAATQALYLAIEAPLLASLLAGAALCRRGRQSGSELRDCIGPLTDAATLISFENTSAVPLSLAADSWLMPGTGGYQYTSDLLEPRLHDDDDLRILLVFYLLERHEIRDLRSRGFSVDDVPVLNNAESERLQSLVMPLENVAPSDFPLLLWRDECGAIKTSKTGQNWTELDNLLSSR